MSGNFVFTTQDVQLLDLGLGRKALEAFPWSRVAALRGFDRVRFLSSCKEAGVQAWVRVNPDVLKSFRTWRGEPHDAPLLEWWSGEQIAIDSAWQQVPMGLAVGLYVLSLESPWLGAPTFEDAWVDDGNGGKKCIQRAVPGFPGLLEFQTEAERGSILEVIASSGKAK